MATGTAAVALRGPAVCLHPAVCSTLHLPLRTVKFTGLGVSDRTLSQLTVCWNPDVIQRGAVGRRTAAAVSRSSQTHTEPVTRHPQVFAGERAECALHSGCSLKAHRPEGERAVPSKAEPQPRQPARTWHPVSLVTVTHDKTVTRSGRGAYTRGYMLGARKNWNLPEGCLHSDAMRSPFRIASGSRLRRFPGGLTGPRASWTPPGGPFCLPWL